MNKTIVIALATSLMCSVPTMAQDNSMTREQIMSMSVEELSELPLEELMKAVEILGVSSVDELFSIIMNKNVSSASKKDESAFTSPLATTVITQEEMRTWGFRTIEEAFRLIPGMIVSQKANGVYDIQLRGLNNIPDGNMLLYAENSNVLLMIDGRVVHNYAIGTMTMENMPISIADVDRIEVVRGACSALYGVNAVNGVINIITRKAADMAKAAVNMTGGSQGTWTGDVTLSRKMSDKLSIGLTANIQQRERPTDKLRAVNATATYVLSDAEMKNHKYGAEDLQAVLSSLPCVTNNSLVDVEKFAQMVTLAPSAELDGTQTFYGATPIEYQDARKCFEDPQLARRTYGVNGYVDITPANGVDIRLTGGYSHSLAMQTTVMESPYSFGFRETTKGYANADVRWGNLHAQANYYAGPEDYAVGRPGLKADFRQVFASADYDIFVGNLNIRPGLYYQYMYGKDDKPTYDYGNGRVELSGFFNDDATLKSFAPSLRLDYSMDKWRFIVAARADKTSIPDKWNLSLQGVVDYRINNKNFVRLNYGHGVRSANMLNANSNYRWQRTGMTYPAVIEFYGNTEADLVSIDNFELGYRIMPKDNILIDAEAFYSRSKDYGAMMCYDSKATTPFSNLYGSIANLWDNAAGGTMDANVALRNVMSQCTTSSNSRYANLPYEVTQMGVSLSADWIVSSKVVAKLNANFQQTKIDNYYLYNQSAALVDQFYGAKGVVTGLSEGLKDIIHCMEGKSADGTEVLTDDAEKMGIKVAQALTSLSHASDYTEMFANLTDPQKETLLNALRDAYFFSNSYIYDKEGIYGKKKTTYQNTLTLYYALKYGMDYDSQTKSYYFGQSAAAKPKTVNGHKHKSTPSVYGMLGVIVKPLTNLNIAAYANFMGKRSMTTAYGTVDLCNRMTLNGKVGYKVMQNMEIFATGDNLLNNSKQEFAYSDKIGGAYALGINFKF